MATRKAAVDVPALIDALPTPLAGLARQGLVRAYRNGTLLMQEGDMGDTLHIVLAGRVRAFTLDEGGERELTFGSYGPGEYVGELSLDQGPRSASVVATETTTCAVVTRRTLRQAIAADPDLAFMIIEKLARRARAATFTARQLALNDVYGRLRDLFEALGQTGEGGQRRVDERLTQRDLAGRIGCSREMVSRVMKDLHAGGYVDRVSPPLRLLRPWPMRW